MARPDENIKKLYNAFVEMNYEVGTEEDFAINLSDPENRRAVYDAYCKEYEAPSFNVFESRLGYGNYSMATGIGSGAVGARSGFKTQRGDIVKAEHGAEAPAQNQAPQMADDMSFPLDKFMSGLSTSDKRVDDSAAAPAHEQIDAGAEGSFDSFGATRNDETEFKSNKQRELEALMEASAIKDDVKPERKGQPALQLMLDAGQTRAQAGFDRLARQGDYTASGSFFGGGLKEDGYALDADGNVVRRFMTPLGTTGDKAQAALERELELPVIEHFSAMTTGGQIANERKRLNELTRKRDELQQELTAEYRDRFKLKDNPFLTYVPTNIGDLDPAHYTMHPEYRQLQAAIRQSEERIAKLERTQDVNTGKDVGFWRGFTDVVTDYRTWTLTPGLVDAVTAYGIKGKLDRGEKLTATEQTLLSVMADNAATGDVDNLWYSAGAMGGYMPKFMLDIALIGGADAAAWTFTSRLTEGMLRQLPKQVSNKITRWAVKAAGATPEMLARGAILANTVQAPKTAADVVNRRMGTAVHNEKGDVEFVDGASWASALYQAEGDAIIEGASEMSGRFIEPALKGVAKKLFNGKAVTAAIAAADRNGLRGIRTATNRFMEHFGLNGIFGEIGEEYAGQLARSIGGLDGAYDQNGHNNFLNLKWHRDIWVGMALTMPLMGAGPATFNAARYGWLRHRVNSADARGNALMGERWDAFRAEVDQTDNGNMQSVLGRVLDDDATSNEQKIAQAEYIESTLNLRGFNLGEMADARAGEAARAEDENERYYLQGLNASASERSGIDAVARAKALSLLGAFGVDVSALADASTNDIINEANTELRSRMGDVDVSDMRQARSLAREKLSPDIAASALDHLKASEVQRGAARALKYEIDEAVAAQGAFIDLCTAPDGMLHQAMMTDGTQVFVRRGSLKLSADGSVDRHNSDRTLIVVDVNGRPRMVSPLLIKAASMPVSADESKAAMAEAVSGHLTSKSYPPRASEAPEASSSAGNAPQAASTPNAAQTQAQSARGAKAGFDIDDEVQLGDGRRGVIQGIDNNGASTRYTVEATDADGNPQVVTVDGAGMTAAESTTDGAEAPAQDQAADDTAAADGADSESMNDIPKAIEVSGEERTEMAARIVDWLSDDNLAKASGKSREEIFEEFGNELMPIAYVPSQYITLVDPALKDPRIYCGKGYFIDHALRSHAAAGSQVPVEDVDVSKYLNIQAVLDNPDFVKETSVDGKRTVVFIKKIGRYFAELTQVEEDGKIVLHKSLFNQKKEPYAKLDDIRQKGASSEGGASSISHTDKSAPAISLKSRGDAMSESKYQTAASQPHGLTSDDKVSNSASEKQEDGAESSAQDTALARVPMDDSGKRQWTAVPADTAWDALVEVSGGEAGAEMIAAAQIEQAQKALDALSKKTPTYKQPKLQGDPVEMAAALEGARKAYEAALADYESRMSDAGAQLDAWKAIAAMGEERTREAKAAAEAEAAVEHARRERLAREAEAARKADAATARQERLEERAGRPGEYARAMSGWEEPTTLEEYILRQLCSGSVKLRWSDKGSSRGLGKHITQGANLTRTRNGADSEYGQRAWMIDERDGLLPETYAERLCQEFYNDYELGGDHYSEVLGELLELCSGYATSQSMYERCKELHAQNLEMDDPVAAEMRARGITEADVEREADFMQRFGMTDIEFAELYAAHGREMDMSDAEYSELMANLAGEIADADVRRRAELDAAEAAHAARGISEQDYSQMRADADSHLADQLYEQDRTAASTPRQGGTEGTDKDGGAMVHSRGLHSAGRSGAHGREGVGAKGLDDVPHSDVQGREAVADSRADKSAGLEQIGGVFSYFAGTLGELIDFARANATGLLKMVVAPVGDRLKADLAKLDVSITNDYKHVVDNHAIRHALKNHGSKKEEQRGQVPLTDADFGRIEDVVSSYDSVRVDPGRGPAPRIIYSKRFEDGTTIFVEEQRKGRKELAAVTMWKTKKTALTDAKDSNTPQISDLNGFSDGKVNDFASEKQGFGAESSLGERVRDAEAEVNTEPTDAQKEAGNYKKGHVQVGTFDVTIEQPVGSVRRGKDADGKEWATTMKNTYGYIRDTEGVDGDHIDVFLSTDIDAWNGRRVVIVDQYNPDGSFDEHKVMLGFNDKADAINAYLANYEEGWEKGRRLVFSTAMLEDFEKWIESSHRKQKPYHEYTIADKAEVEESVPENPVSVTDYTIDTYTTKKNKTYHRVVFPRADKEVWQERLNLAKKMGGTSVPKGYGFKSREDAEAFAKAVAEPTSVGELQSSDKGDTSAAPNIIDQEHHRPTELFGDSAAFQEREAQIVTLVDEIGDTIEDRVRMLQLDTESVKPLTMAEVKKMATKYSALKDVSDTDLQELVELAMTQLTRSEAIINVDGTAEQQRAAFDHIVNLYQIQPSLNARDSERLIKQQYSTPTPFGYVMGQFVRAGGKTVDSMLEPSAGNGALTITVHPSLVHVNDIDEARLANLRKLGYGQVTAQDALLPFSGDKVDVVMTNPPFGTVTEKVYDGIFHVSSLEGQMAINSLEKMKDDGRAAIIIGGNTSYRTNGSMNPKDAAFFGYLYSHYNVADVINISGKALYSRNGTGYDVRMILIDGRKTGEFQRVFPPVKAKARTEQVTTFDELYKRVQDDIQQIQQVGSQSADVQRDPGTATDGTAGATIRSRNNSTNFGAGQRPGTTSDAVRDTPRTNSRQPTPGNDGSQPAGMDNADAGNAGSTDYVQRPKSTGAGRGELDNSVEDGRGRSGNDGHNTASSRPGRSTERLAVKPDLTAEKVPYPNQSGNGFTLMSVVPAAQAQVLQKSLGEIATYSGGKLKVGDVDQYLVDELGYSSKDELYSYLAAEQIDSVALAIHQMNKGNAFIIGDMTGVGKGRQGAALIRYAVKQGKVPIYFTQKPTLFTDNYRDLADIGSSDLRPFIIASNPKDANIVDGDGNVVHKLPSKKEQERVFAYIMEHGTLPDEYDYVLTTYDQIKNGTADYAQNEDGTWNTEARQLPKKSKGYTTADYNGQTRRDALAKLAEGNIAILDESHTVGGDSGCGRYMQMLTSSAEGVTFLSATFAKRADNMPIYAQRTAIAEAGVKASELIEAIMKGGVTLQEIMSKQLVESGQMIRRERSFEGVTIDWLNVEEETNRRQRQQFNEVADIFNAIRNFQDDYITPIIDTKNEAAAEWGATVGHTQGTKDLGVKNVPFASKMYNLVNQLLFALKVEAVADRVVENLRNGYKPVISFTNTMEGFLSSAPKGVKMDEVPNFSLTLMRALDGVMRFTEKDADENTEGGTIPLSELSADGHKAYNAIHDKIMNLSADLPISPMDAIRMKIEEAGYSVAEITGRTMQLNRTEDGKYIVEARKDRDKKAAMRDFNSGKLDVLMINKSGSTGISLHASSKFEDRRPRVMVFAQFQSDINDEVQMRGRIDRSGQITRGRYEYIMSTIPAEQRIQMMFKAKLKSLDANTTSSQKSKFNEMEIVDYLNKYGDEVVWEYMKEHPDLAERLGDPLNMLQEKNSEDNPRTAEKEDTSKKTGCAGKISRYLAFLPVEEQDEIFKEITEAYRVKIQLLDDAGENDLEITTMPLRAETKRKQIWHDGVNPGSGNAFADNTYVEEVEVDVLKKPMKREEVAEYTRKLAGNLYSESNGVIDWEHYTYNKGEEIHQFYQSKADEAFRKMQEAGENRIAKAREKAVTSATKARGRGENNFTDEQIQSLADTVAHEEREKEEMKQNKRQNEIMGVNNRIQALLNRLRAGNIYVVPQDLKQSTAGMFSQTFGTFVGFKFNKSYTLGSSTAIFATLDGRRKVELALSDPAIDTIISATEIANRYSLKEIKAITMENWDSKVPTQTRQKRYIITGNLLQALVDTEKGEKTRGNLISYSTIDGETRQGILMGENFKPTDLRNSASLSSRLAQIHQGETVVSENGDVQIEKVSFGWQHRGQYELRAPKSKQRGGIYTMHSDLLQLVEGHNFITKGNNMVAYVDEADIAKVVDMLSRAPFNLTVLQESQLSDVSAEETEDDMLFRDGKRLEEEKYIDTHMPSSDLDARSARITELKAQADAFAENYNSRAVTVVVSVSDIENEELSDAVKDRLTKEFKSGAVSASYCMENKKIYIFASAEGNAMGMDYVLFHENVHAVIDAMPTYPREMLDALAKAIVAYNPTLETYYSEVMKEYGAAAGNEELAAFILSGMAINPAWVKRLMRRLSPELRSFGYDIINKIKKTDNDDNSNSKSLYRAVQPGASRGRGASDRDGELAAGGADAAGADAEERRLSSADARTAGVTVGEMAAHVAELASKLHLDNVEVVTDASQLEGKRAKAKGFYNKRTGKITIIIPNHVSRIDVEQTLLHEAVAHYGLRHLFGEHFDTFLDNVYESADESIRRQIDRMAAQNGWNFHTATEEYLATLAEDINFENAQSYDGWWSKVKRLFLDMLKMVGFEGFREKAGVVLTDNELRYILWRSYKNLSEPGRYHDMLSEAIDTSKQQELKVGNYADKVIEAEHAAEPANVDEINERFNNELRQQIDGTLPEGHVYEMGMPSKYLRSTGIENLPIRLSAKILNFKSNLKRHAYSLEAVKNLVKAIQKPWAIFAYGDKAKAQNLIIGIEDNGRQFLVGLSINPTDKGRSLEINSIRNVFPKNNHEWVNWINEGKLLRVDGKEEIQAVIAKLRMNPVAFDYLDLDNAAKVVNNFENPTLPSENNADSEEDVLYRTAREEYDMKVRAVAVHDKYGDGVAVDSDGKKMKPSIRRRLHEAYFDSMASLKILQDVIAKETGKPIEEYENAYWAENRMSSMNRAHTDRWKKMYFEPIINAVTALAKDRQEYRDLLDYMIAKHGLERNAVMRVQALADGKDGDRDFAGLTALTNHDPKDWQPAEADARALVRNYESAHSAEVIDNLWAAIRAATRSSLQTRYEAGLITKDVHTKLQTMYDYYIPLKGWKDMTAGDMYEYAAGSYAMGSALHGATGRASIADDPLATIGVDGELTIREANRNRMKQHLLNLAINHRSTLLTVGRQWYVYDAQTGGYIEADAPIKPEYNADEIAACVEQFNQDMKQKEAQGLAFRSRAGLRLGLPIKPREYDEHIIKVKRAGETYCIYLNADPRAAQAVNGILNPDNADHGRVHETLQAVKNAMARLFTSYNPSFVATNLARDLMFASAAVAAKESPKYNARYQKNINALFWETTLAAPLSATLTSDKNMWQLVRLYNANRLDMNDARQRYFHEFMSNGGETGFTEVNRVDDVRKDIQRYIKDANGGTTRQIAIAGKKALEAIEYANRCIEDMSRFAVYMTSRQQGRSIAESVWDAKEITVNFNKKGSGEYGARAMNFLYIFFNAAVQATANVGRIIKRHPVRAGFIGASFMAAGLLAPMLNTVIGQLFCGDGDDDDKYGKLPEWVRRNNLVLRIPFTDRFLTYPLPHELRPLYGCGEIGWSVMNGKEELEEGFSKAAEGFTGMLPIDFTGNGGNVLVNITPTALQPISQAIANVNYFGKPIYKDTPFNKDNPAWSKAYKSTHPFLVEASRLVSEAGATVDEYGVVHYPESVLTGDINPAIVQHLFESYLGGTGKFFSDAARVIESIGEDEGVNWQRTPIVNKFIQNDDEQSREVSLRNRYFRAKDKYDKLQNEYRAINRQKYEDGIDYAGNKARFLMSPEGQLYLSMKRHLDKIDALKARINKVRNAEDALKYEAGIANHQEEFALKYETFNDISKR